MKEKPMGDHPPERPTRFRLLFVIGPGLLVAATGVGAGDLATAAFAGSKIGIAVLWAVLVGAFLKFVLNEGLARWQLATDQTLLEGAVEKFGIVLAIVFLPYLLVWSFLVALALMSACGVTLHAILPVFDDPVEAKQYFGILQGAVGVALVLAGGFRLFEKVMSVCIGVMFVTVVVTAACLWPGTGTVVQGLVFPDPATLKTDSLGWTVALMGGVGGTVTVLCYGYWIREKERKGKDDLALCRVDLGVAYGMTAIFGVSMVVIGDTVQTADNATGATLIVDLAARLEDRLTLIGKWAFLIGAWGAVFSSLLGVWQAVPYLFADVWGLLRRRLGKGSRDSREHSVDTKSWPYRSYLFVLAFVPMVWLDMPFSRVQKFYAIWGAVFIPLLALALVILNGRTAWVGERFRNRWPTALVLLVALVFFLWIAWRRIP